MSTSLNRTESKLATRLRGRQDRNAWFWVFVGPFFLGLGNYVYLLQDPAFVSSMATFVVFALFIVPVTFAGSLALALLVNKAKVAQAFFRSVFFLPTACSYVIAAMIWRLSFFNGARFGLFNSALRSLGFDNINWLGGGDYWYWVVLVTLRLWLQVGFSMILFLAGLQRIPATRTRRRPSTARGTCSGSSRCRSCGPRRSRCCCCSSSAPSRRSTSFTTP